ncbi:MAG: hypothetical protein ACD_11C00145G0003 [uncultured bacterium]|nr:MAG: hypothetical protein ACD_11C00145G0003 [uncultured bacterium]HBR71628.1 hypothetical protein [Candidatus Moranbacteria bacterium]
MEKFNMFDPKNPDYEKHSDLPKAMQKDYAEAGEGFVKKEAEEKYVQAEEVAYKNYKSGNSEDLNPLDILHSEALVDEKKKTEETPEFKRKELHDLIKKLDQIGERGEGHYDVREEIANMVIKWFRDDKEIVLKTIPLVNMNKLDKLVYKFTNDDDVVAAAIKRRGLMLGFASERLQNNRKLALEAVKEDGHYFEYATKKIRSDKEIVGEAAKSDSCAVMYVEGDLKNDKAFLLDLVKLNWYGVDTIKDIETKDNYVNSIKDEGIKKWYMFVKSLLDESILKNKDVKDQGDIIVPEKKGGLFSRIFKK